MQLYGSTTSPYVRRIRLYLALLAKQSSISDESYQFVNLDIFSDQGREKLTKDNPTLKVPYLIDGEQSVFDSRVIYRYLAEKFSQPKLSWQDENLLTLMDAANDSFVSLFLTKRSGLDNKQDCLFFNLQNERVSIIVSQLNDALLKGDFNTWDYPSICLFSLLDWANLRELYPFSEFPALLEWVNEYKLKTNLDIAETDPRN